MQRQAIDRDGPQQGPESVARERPRGYRLEKHHIRDPVRAPPSEVVALAESEPFVDAPLATEHRMTFPRPAEGWGAVADVIVHRNDVPAPEIADAFVVEIDEHDVRAVQDPHPIVARNDHQRIVIEATQVRTRDRTDRRARGRAIHVEEAPHGWAEIVHDDLSREATLPLAAAA